MEEVVCSNCKRLEECKKLRPWDWEKEEDNRKNEINYGK